MKKLLTILLTTLALQGFAQVDTIDVQSYQLDTINSRIVFKFNGNESAEIANLKGQTKVISSAAYTLTSADNNSVLIFSNSCVVTCPVLTQGFKATIIRQGGVVSIVGGLGVVANSYLNYLRLLANGSAILNYTEPTKVFAYGNLTK